MRFFRRFRPRRPSPAMVVALTALVMASTGSAVAAVTFAKRAGSVDGRSAVGPGSSLRHAAGRLVATRSKGGDAGQIPNRFLANVPSTTTFGRYSPVTDNAAGATATLDTSDFGTLSAACNDQDNRGGTEDPTSTITFANTAPFLVNLARTVGAQNPVVTALPAGTQHSFQIRGSNTFRIQLEAGLVDVVYEGQVRQDGRGTGDASCLVAGTVQVFRQ